MKKIFLTMALTIGLMATAQVKIGANPTSINTASLLELESSTQGVLFPRVALVNTTTATLAGGAHVQGMTVYNTATAGDVTPGMYTNDGVKWVKLGGSATPAYQNIGGKITTVTTSSYTVAADDFTVITNSGSGVTITLPALTTNETGRMINIINNNTAAVANTITSAPNTLPVGTGLNQFRGRSYVWTGTIWLAVALN